MNERKLSSQSTELHIGENTADRDENQKYKRKKNASELRQLHNLELLVRNEETAGFLSYYLRNQR